jgi:dihydroorotate dehydrogenase
MAYLYDFKRKGVPLLVEEAVSKRHHKQWWPLHPPIYDVYRSYLDNAEEGPFFHEPYPERLWPKEEHREDFLGYKVASKLGIPAGPLLNSRWIALAANLGFDILCYKTIRSSESPGHPVPNIIYVESDGQLDPQALPDALKMRVSPPKDIDAIAITNSFGMPSRSRSYLAEDIPKAQAALHPGQVMIVSVVGTPDGTGLTGLIDDFVVAACQAKEYGAKVIEANLSCPNVSTGEGSLYNAPEVVGKLTKKIVSAIGEIPLILKVGAFDNDKEMEEAFIAAARSGARAICGVNTLSMKVVDSDGKAALGEKRPVSGICGSPIRQSAIDFTEQAYAINKKNRLDLTLMTTGGAVLPEHFDAFFSAGADVAMTATGMMWDPYISMNYHHRERDNGRS